MLFSGILRGLRELEVRIKSNHDEVSDRLVDIEKVMIVQEVNLADHMKRSDHLESLMHRLEENEIKPLVRHVAMVNGAIKLIGILSLVTGILVGVFKLVGAI